MPVLVRWESVLPWEEEEVRQEEEKQRSQATASKAWSFQERRDVSMAPAPSLDC